MNSNPESRVLLSCRLINDVVVSPEGIISFDLNCLKTDIDAMVIISKHEPVEKGDVYKLKLAA